MILKRELKSLLAQATHCHIQHTGWTCGTCFFAISDELTNKDWQSLLYKRGDHTKSELKNLPDDIDASINKIVKLTKAYIKGRK